MPTEFTTQKDIFEEAAFILNDETYKRWTPQKLNKALNRALRTIVTLKPDAFSYLTKVDLVAGAQQSLPSTNNRLVRVIGNSDENFGILSKVTPIEREQLETVVPQWANPDVVPATKLVEHVVLDDEEPQAFFVYPPNDGTGSIRVQMTGLPAILVNGSTPGDASTYTLPLSIDDDMHREAVLYFTVAHALEADLGLPNAAERALYFENKARTLIGVKQLNQKTKAPRDAYKPEGD